VEKLAFLTEDLVREAQQTFGTPLFIYDQRTLERQAQAVLDFPSAYGLTARYAMKALPTAAIVRLLTGLGLHVDASSGFEAERAMRAGVDPGRIQLTAQEMPANLGDLLDAGVLFTASSLHQLATFGALRPGADVCVRVNPGLGTGHNNRVTRMHTHVGSGADPEVWRHCAQLALAIVARLPDVHTLSLGGGFKVGRMADEVSTDLQTVGEAVARDFQAFAEQEGRELDLEIEPGTFLVADAGALVCTAIDVIDTGPDGYAFIKTDSGMTEVARPCMYGAQHPIVVVPATPESRGQGPYLVVGHCCESGDLLTPAPGDPEGLQPRLLTEPRIGDAVVVGGAGAYCAAMAAKNYNSFPEAPEVLLTNDGEFRLIRQRQTLEQMTANET